MILTHGMQNLLMVFVGGGLGSLVRYGTTLWAARLFGTGFPWGTLIVNLAGCFAAGLFIGVAERSELISHATRLFILIGFLGGLTTFSTFGVDTFNAGRAGDSFIMIANLIANNAAGMLMVFLGFQVTRLHG